MENPRVLTSPSLEATWRHRGRPPNVVDQIDFPLVLERPGSPVETVDTRTPKKSRNDSVHAMEGVKVQILNGNVSDGHINSRVILDGKDGVLVSYASMAKSGLAKEGCS
ncbi:hypothetical protein V6N13_135376 [Hibiscus sabdariffa]|uniref:Uncharacterized protein n=1 Tax=Hibiscus sabdariffa TaxID=183260 RepID=A0ABR2R6U9_9ROSI